MRIIERCELPEERIYVVKCANCKSTIEFAEHEAKKTYDQRAGNYLIIDCLVCDQSIYRSF